MSESVRVLILEREALYRRGLAGCLAADSALEVVGSAALAEEGYRLADELAPDVVLIGTTLSDAPGLTGANELRRRFPALATIVVAANESDDELFAAIRAGASAYCGKDVPEATLIDLIKRSLKASTLSTSSSSRNRTLPRVCSNSSAPRPSAISPRPMRLRR